MSPQGPPRARGLTAGGVSSETQATRAGTSQERSAPKASHGRRAGGPRGADFDLSIKGGGEVCPRPPRYCWNSTRAILSTWTRVSSMLPELSITWSERPALLSASIWARRRASASSLDIPPLASTLRSCVSSSHRTEITASKRPFPAGFVDERRLHDGGAVSLQGQPVERLFHGLQDGGVGEGLQARAARRVGKDDFGQLPSVDRPVGKQDLPAEFPEDGRIGAAAGGRHLPGNPVGVEDRDSRPAEHVGHRALSRTDVSRQAEDPHGANYIAFQWSRQTESAALLTSSNGSVYGRTY